MRRRKSKGAGLNPCVAEAAIRRAVNAQAFDAAYNTVLSTLAGMQEGAQQALDDAGCIERSSLGDTVGRAIGSAIALAFDTVKSDGVPVDLPENDVRAAAKDHIRSAVCGTIVGALALEHSIAASRKGGT